MLSRVIELSLLEAQAAYAAGKDQQTWVALERALVIAQTGYINIFHQGPNLSKLLILAEKKGICRETIGRILAAGGTPTSNFSRIPAVHLAAGLGMVENLSQRELEVLNLMAQGSTNQAIADHLVISVGTVKSHINHILGKLGAHNRTEAVSLARKLRLV